MIRNKHRNTVLPTRIISKYCIYIFLLFFWIPALAFAEVQVTLQWDDTNEKELSGFRIFCRQDGESYDYSKPAWEGNATTCSITDKIINAGIPLKENTEYYFVARAVDSNGNESGDSNEVHFLQSTDGAGSGSGDTGDTQTSPAQPVPDPQWETSQATNVTPLLNTTGYTDTNDDNYHNRSQWQIFRKSDQKCVFDRVSTEQLTELDVPPLVLDADTDYYWTVRFYNQHEKSSEWSNPAHFTTGSTSGDNNDNGIPDGQEAPPATDLDQDGVSDSEQNHIMSVNVANSNTQIGISILGSANIQSIEAAQSIDPVTAPSHLLDKQISPKAIIAFKLTLDQPGAKTGVKVFLSETPAEGNKWYYYDMVDKWQEYDDGSAVTQNEKTVLLTIEDGGFGDADGLANGIIINQTGSANLAAPQTGGDTGGDSAGGGAGCFIQSLLPMF